jgi:FkbM family methyltransferase
MTHAGENVKILVPSVRLEDVVKEDVLLLKVDVEGWEWSVLKGAAGLISGFNVENIIMEYSPGR